jgi:hypothetical protein
MAADRKTSTQPFFWVPWAFQGKAYPNPSPRYDGAPPGQDLHSRLPGRVSGEPEERRAARKRRWRARRTCK